MNYDHLENYSNNWKKQLSSFKEFVGKSSIKIINNNLKDIFSNYSNLHTFSIEEGELHIEDVKFYDFSSEFTVINGKDKFKAKLNVPYFHNIENALAASLASKYFDISLRDSFKSLSSYKGVKRRFEIKFRDDKNNLYIIDDYAHNPREVSHTVKAAKIKGYDLWVIFQPHRYSRFKSHWKEFAESLKFADNIIITDIFGAYENDGEKVSPVLLKNELSSMNKNAYYINGFTDIKNFISDNFKKNAVLLTLGAGTVTNLCDDIVKIYV
jgi:UDP-N-acetylmuramate--alanine ligase